MRTLMIVVLIMLTCSCHPFGNTQGEMTRYDEVNSLIDEDLYVVRGPLTLEQVESELAASYERRMEDAPNMRYVPKYEDSFGAKLWAQFKSRYEEGGVFYFFRTKAPKRRVVKSGQDGYVLVRRDQVIAYYVTSMYTIRAH